MIRYDIVQDLRRLYDQAEDASIRWRVPAPIETETDLKHRKKYVSLWQVARPGASKVA